MRPLGKRGNISVIRIQLKLILEEQELCELCWIVTRYGVQLCSSVNTVMNFSLPSKMWNFWPA